MRDQILARLGHTSDFAELTGALLDLCEPYGPVHSTRLIHSRRAHRVACFIELESPKKHGALALALGAHGLSGSVCLDVPVRADFGRGERTVSLAA